MKKVLIVIDVQKYFINKHTKDLPKKIAEFIEDKKNFFDKIFFFKFQNKKGSNWTKLLNWHKMKTEDEIEVAHKLLPYSKRNNTFVKKASFSIFRVNDFVSKLKKNKISKLYLCGLDTDACVYVSLFEAFERGHDVKVIQDLCASHWGKKHHNEAIKSFKRNLGKNRVTSSTEIK